MNRAKIIKVENYIPEGGKRGSFGLCVATMQSSDGKTYPAYMPYREYDKRVLQWIYSSN